MEVPKTRPSARASRLNSLRVAAKEVRSLEVLRGISRPSGLPLAGCAGRVPGECAEAAAGTARSWTGQRNLFSGVDVCLLCAGHGADDSFCPYFPKAAFEK